MIHDCAVNGRPYFASTMQLASHSGIYATERSALKRLTTMQLNLPFGLALHLPMVSLRERSR